MAVLAGFRISRKATEDNQQSSPTNQSAVGVRHVKIGHGRDYEDVQPLRGVFSGGASAQVTPEVEIRRLPAVESVHRVTPIGLLGDQHQHQHQQ